MENEKCTLKDLEYVEKTENHGKRETHTVGPGIWLEILKTWETRNAHCRTKNKAGTEKKLKNETNTIWPGIWRETIKLWKKRNALTRIWSMARKLKIMENEKHTL